METAANNKGKFVLPIKAVCAALGVGTFLIYVIFYPSSFIVSDSYILFLTLSVLISWLGFRIPGMKQVSIATLFFAVVTYLEFGFLPSAALFALSNAFRFNADKSKENIFYRVGAGVLIVFFSHLAYTLFLKLSVNEKFNTPAFLAFLFVCFVTTSWFDALCRYNPREPKKLEKIWLSVLGANFLVTVFAGSFAVSFVLLQEVKPDISIFALAGVSLFLLVMSFLFNRRERAQRLELEQTRGSLGGLVEILSAIIEAKDKHDWGHVLRVRAYSLGLARRLELFSENELKGLALAALLHDIGKIAIPEVLLMRPGSISPDEFERVKNHSVVGAELLRSVSIGFPLSRVVKHHHERWDGTGYPDGLIGENIPIFSRIIAIADTYDSLCSSRPYRAAYSRAEAIQILRNEAGSKLDPKLVEIFLNNLNEIENEAKHKSLTEGYIRSGDDRALLAQMSVIREMVETASETAVLHEIGELVEKSLAFDQVANHLLEALARRIDSDAYLIYLFGENRDLLEVRFFKSSKYSELATNRLKVGEGVTGWAVKNREPLYNVNPAPDFVNMKGFKHQLKSALVIPLKSRRKILGAVALYSEKPYAFEREHVAIAKKLSLVSAEVMLNAMEYKETVKESLTDALTELPNLRAMREFFEVELIQKKTPCAILMIDMDDLKWINDNFGHGAGDESLRRVAQAIRLELREQDALFRYGGDEFVAVVKNVDYSNIALLTKRIKERVSSLVLDFDGRLMSFSISVGFAFYPDDSDNPFTVLSMADSAMYSDKRSVH